MSYPMSPWCKCTTFNYLSGMDSQMVPTFWLLWTEQQRRPWRRYNSIGRPTESTNLVCQEFLSWILWYISLHIFEEAHTDFHHGLTGLHTPVATNKCPSFPVSLLVCSIICFVDSGYSDWVRWSKRVLSGVSMITKDVCVSQPCVLHFLKLLFCFVHPILKGY